MPRTGQVKMVSTGLIAIIPATKDVPLKKILDAIAFTKLCREIMKAIVVSDQAFHSQVTAAGAWFFPAKAGDFQTPVPRIRLMTDVAAWYEQKDGEVARFLFQLDPLHPPADPVVVFECLQRLIVNGMADGILGLSTGRGISIGNDGWLEVDEKGSLQLDGTVYMLRHDFARHEHADWLRSGHFLPYQTDLVGDRYREELL
jgi:hypothetical protein